VCVCVCVCVRFTGADGPSGFGFELTFRLKREMGETAPPTWPAELMQGLARYVFQSGESTALKTQNKVLASLHGVSNQLKHKVKAIYVILNDIIVHITLNKK